jgi:hypothetical protein
MERQAIRDRLAKALRRGEVPDPLWRELDDEGHVDAVLTGDDEAFAAMVAAARRWQRVHRALAAWERERQPKVRKTRVAPDLGDYVKQRGLARDEAVARRAAREREVRAFRKSVLGGVPLSVPLARRLLASAAARVWPASEFVQRGVPIVGHRGEVLDNRSRLEDGWFKQEVDFRVTWDGGSVEATASHASIPGPGRPAPIIVSVDEHREELHAEGWPHSVLDRLREVAERLAGFYGFDPAQAAWFVLTDDPPRRDPVGGTVTVQTSPNFADMRVTLAVDPWVPADVVLKTYRDIQRGLFRREIRPLSLRNLAALRSVLADAREAARVNPDASPPSRAWSMERWNREHPDQPYAQEWRFSRDVDRAERAVLFRNAPLGAALEDEEVGP